MLEYPEVHTIATQMADTIVGKAIARAQYYGEGRNFLWSNSDAQAFAADLKGATLRAVECCANNLYLATDKKVGLMIGDTGGKILYHKTDATVPVKKVLLLDFDDGSLLTYSMQMWGMVSLLSAAEWEAEKANTLRNAVLPNRQDMNYQKFLACIESIPAKPKLAAKQFITKRIYVTGLGSGYSQDILFRAGLHPKRGMHTLERAEAKRLFDAIIRVVGEARKKGGRDTEFDLFNNKGGYGCAMGKKALGEPCPVCGTEIAKFSFAGGTCYACPKCQGKL